MLRGKESLQVAIWLDQLSIQSVLSITRLDQCLRKRAELPNLEQTNTNAHWHSLVASRQVMPKLYEYNLAALRASQRVLKQGISSRRIPMYIGIQ